MLLRLLLPRPAFIALPELFQTLYLAHVNDAPCASCGRHMDDPALCLVTGRTLCSPRGCRGGARDSAKPWDVVMSPDARTHCLLHSGGGSGCLLLLKSTRVLAIRNGRVTLCQSLFLDAHGEEDVQLKRGRPLKLSVGVYGALSRLWAGAGLDFDSTVLHRTTGMFF